MKIIKFTLCVFAFICLPFFSQAQSEVDLVGSYGNGIQMGGSTLTLSSDGTFEIVDDHMGTSVATGDWELLEYGYVTFIYDDNGICDENYEAMNQGDWVLSFQHPYAIEPLPIWRKFE